MNVALKIGAACVMTAACAWGGRLFSLTQQRRSRTLEEILSGVRRLNVEMLEYRLPLHAALSVCGSIYAETARQMGENISPRQAYENALRRMRERGGALDSLQEEEMTALSRLFGSLGEGSAQQQRLLLNDTAEELDRILVKARRQQEQSGRLYTSLSALGGLAAALIMI